MEPALIASQVSEAAVWVPGRLQCLERSLALYYLLRRQGFKPTFLIGVQPLPFRAHAWVELGGSVVNEDEERIRNLVILTGRESP